MFSLHHRLHRGDPCKTAPRPAPPPPSASSAAAGKTPARRADTAHSVATDLERLNRIELARYLHDCPPHSAQWHAAMAVWHTRFARLSQIQNYALYSVLFCAFIIALIGLLH